MTDDSSTNDAEDVSTLTTDRRRFLQAATVAGTGLTGIGGFASAQQSSDTHIELEAVTVETSGGRGRSEFAWEDGEGGVVRGPPEEVCSIAGGTHLWVGVSPDSIAELTNPTLELTAGETYTVEWTNTDGEEHNFVIADADGTELVASETVSEEGATQSVEFEATEEMATYYCDPHSTSQRGDVRIADGTPFELSGLDPSEATVTMGDVASFDVTVTHTGDGSETGTVTLSVDSQQMDSREVTLDAGASTTVSLDVDTTGLTAGDRTVVVASGGSRVSGTLTVEADDEWIQLFNGEDLDDWTPKFSGREPGVNYNDVFTVEDGVLRVGYGDYGDEWDSVFGHLFYDGEFSHYALRAEYRFVGEQVSGAPDWAFRNNGLMLHGQTPEEMDVDQDYPDSIEVQLLGQSADSDGTRTTANVCTPGTNIVMDGSLHEQHCTSSSSDTYRGDQWVTVTVIVRGNELIRHVVEDDGVVMQYTEPQLDDGTPLDSGTISIQSESHPTEFRTIELKPIDPEAPIEAVEPSSPLWSSYTKDELASGLEQPMAIEVTPDHRVFFTTRGPPVDGDGNTATTEVGVVDPETEEVTTALELDVHTSGEDGLQGLTLDPDFEENGWIYLYYSAPHEIIDEEPHKRLSRFTVNGDTIDPESEVEILRVPAADNPCCHVGGDLEFGPEGNLFLSTGDDTSPFQSSGYTPIDERDGRELFDAQRSSANTNDLRGSILRISPNDDGTYDIPDGNMFTGPEYADARENDLVREEIYVMGCRNPFRMDVDEDGVLYWANYGADAGAWDAERGPPGIVEFNRAEEPGFYGWPYVVGPDIPFVDGEFATEDGERVFNSSGEPFDPENLRNTSPNNTGLTELPEPEQPVIWYPYSWDGLLNSPPDYATEYLPDEPPFPDFEGGAPMGGPVYDFRDSYDQNALPERFFDGKQLIGEWGQQWLRYVSYDDDGAVEEIDEFMPDESFLSPMDLTVGPDGTLYLLEWGDGYAGSPMSSQSGIYRIERAVNVDFPDVENGEVASGPGTTTTVNGTVTNPFDSAIQNGEVSLGAPDDAPIEVTPVEGQTFDSLGPYQSQSMFWEVTIPDGSSGSHDLTATVSYTGTEGEHSRSEPAFTVTVGQRLNLAGDWQFQTGDDAGWSDPSFDDSGWETVELPDHWEDHSDYTDAEAFGWYRKTVTVPESWEDRDVTLQAGMIDDVDETFVNGTRVGQTGTFPENGYDTAWDAPREYTVSGETIDYGGENVVAIRVYDGDGPGGLYEGPLLMSPSSDSGGGDQTLQDGLEAHLPLDGDTPTNEVTGADATLQGGVATGQSGVVGNAYEVHTNQETGVEIPPAEAEPGDAVVTESLPLNGEAATAAAWINVTDHEQWARAPFQVGGSPAALTNGWDLEFSSNDDAIIPQVWQDGSPSRGSGPDPIPIDRETWYFVVMVVDGGDSRLHVFDQNGEIDASPRSWSGSRTQTDEAPLVLGTGQGYDMAGRIDDVWAYSRALSPDEVSDLHSLSLEGDSDGGNALDDTPADWSTTTYGGSAEHAYVAGEAAGGDRSVNIASSSGADASWVQTVSLEPNTEYTVRAQVKTEDVQPVDGTGQADVSGAPFGATISVGTIANANYPDVSGPIPEPLTGTNDWTTLETTFDSGDYDGVDYGAVEVLALFGGYGQATGTAWYDDFELVGPDGNDLLSNAGFETGSTAAIDPSTTIQLGGQVSGWTGQGPASIEGTSNPTLTLQAGETYTVEWVNLDGIGHNFEVLDHDQPDYSGHVVDGVSTGTMSTEGETQTVEFTATEEMVRYQCRPHRTGMHGDIEVVDSGQ
ncbi:family 16 glycoside hydrolase [Halomicrobium urmianum]|uniref:family 16 glycoside hydrolase n=1 Tax=Halomicrobium urmianum TaxID=1586233 RepID=UPI001CD96689|nr:family 16 glycoside hydrolase [Halomicrobium urmianum]